MEIPYIVVVGSLNYDMIYKVARLPLKGETFTADELFCCGGGKGANQAVQCAKLGVKTCMAGSVGKDFFGKALLDGLQSYGVDIANVRQSATHATGTAAVNALPNGEVYATISTGANFDLDSAFAQGLKPLISKASALVLQMEIPIPVVEALITLGQQCGVYTLLNAAPAKAINPAILKQVDCLIVNESEGEFYLGHSMDTPEKAAAHIAELRDMVKETAIITLGRHGSLLCDCTGITKFAVDETVVAVETTGAGDSFIGAFVVRKTAGDSNEAACLYAGRVAGFTVARVGAQEAMPTLEEMNS